MSPLGRIGIFVAGLLLVFGAAAALGSLVEPRDTERGGHADEEHVASQAGAASGGHGGHEGSADPPAGLAVSAHGYSLRLDSNFLRTGERRDLRFAILGADGAPLTGFDELHERRMHLIVVRRDGSGFRHLHPEINAAGTWSVPLELAAAGPYRVFADFSVGGEQRTLAADLFVSGGEFEARPFPPPRRLALADDGYEVRLDAGEQVAGEPASLGFAVSRDGEPVGDLDPYLGAQGHLVALREGDLAFLHVHPEEGLSFGATFPTAGRYRLYLQIKHQGVVRTAAFTVEVRR